jgi:uncharacterized membrane protein (DUF2068 family)
MKLMKADTLKTLTVGVIGTGATWTIACYNEWIAAIAGTFTAIFMAFKIYDVIASKISEKRRRHYKYRD